MYISFFCYTLRSRSDFVSSEELLAEKLVYFEVRELIPLLTGCGFRYLPVVVSVTYLLWFPVSGAPSCTMPNVGVQAAVIAAASAASLVYPL